MKIIRKLIVSTILILTSCNVFAQYTLDWEQNAGVDSKLSVMSAIDSLDNVVVTGYLQSYQMFTRKYDI